MWGFGVLLKLCGGFPSTTASIKLKQSRIHCLCSLSQITCFKVILIIFHSTNIHCVCICRFSCEEYKDNQCIVSLTVWEWERNMVNKGKRLSWCNNIRNKDGITIWLMFGLWFGPAAYCFPFTCWLSAFPIAKDRLTVTYWEMFR